MINVSNKINVSAKNDVLLHKAPRGSLSILFSLLITEKAERKNLRRISSIIGEVDISRLRKQFVKCSGR